MLGGRGEGERESLAKGFHHEWIESYFNKQRHIQCIQLDGWSRLFKLKEPACVFGRAASEVVTERVRRYTHTHTSTHKRRVMP